MMMSDGRPRPDWPEWVQELRRLYRSFAGDAPDEDPMTMPERREWRELYDSGASPGRAYFGDDYPEPQERIVCDRCGVDVDARHSAQVALGCGLSDCDSERVLVSGGRRIRVRW